MSDIHDCSDEDPINQGPAANFREQASSDFTFTWLRDQFAQRKRLIRLSSTEKFARCLRATRASSKAALPWAKLAELGPTRSPNDSFRYDANVVALFGAEGDYDGDDVPIEDAAALIQAAGIEAVLNETTTPGHWRIWLPASRAYRGSTDELRSLRATWVAQANGVLGGILARESFVLSQAFYLGGIEGQPPIKVITTVGARIDLCDDLSEGALYKNGTSSPGERREPVETAGDATPSGDDLRLLRECQSRMKNFANSRGYGTTPTGLRVFHLVTWLGDIGTRDGLTPSAAMIREAIREDYPQTTRAMIESMLTRRHQPRGWDVIDPVDTLIWAEGVEPSDD